MLTGVIPPQNAARRLACSILDTGLNSFLGRSAMGLLYDKSMLAVALFSVILQLAVVPILFVANKER
jgi:hypothetical protein